MVDVPKPPKLHPTSNGMSIQSGLATGYAVDGDIDAPLHCSTCSGGGGFLSQ